MRILLSGLAIFLYLFSILKASPLGLQVGITDYASALRLSDVPYYGVTLHLPAGKQTELMFTFEHSFGKKALDDTTFFSTNDLSFLGEADGFSYTALGIGGHYFLQPNAKGLFVFMLPKWIFFSDDLLSVWGVSLGLGVGVTHRIGSIRIRPHVGIQFHSLLGQWYRKLYYEIGDPHPSVSYQMGIQVNYSALSKKKESA